MPPRYALIAEAALRGYPAADHEELFSQIADYTGYSVEEVEEILGNLTADKTLTDRFVPILNPTAQKAGFEIVQAWYEKGPMWNEPRTPVVW